jgi:hypothetical protein
LGGGVLATEEVTVERDSGKHLLRTTIGPPAQVAVPFAAYRSLIWRIVQSTESKTVEATVKLDFHTGPTGPQRLIDCRLTRWTSTVNIIEHSGKWSLPPAWPWPPFPVDQSCSRATSDLSTRPDDAARKNAELDAHSRREHYKKHTPNQRAALTCISWTCPTRFDHHYPHAKQRSRNDRYHPWPGDREPNRDAHAGGDHN